MGAEDFLLESDAAQEEITAALGGAPDIVFQCAGVPGTIPRSIALVRPQGRFASLDFCMVPTQSVPALALMQDLALRFSLTYTHERYTENAGAPDTTNHP